jgi:hypothetical protein
MSATAMATTMVTTMAATTGDSLQFPFPVGGGCNIIAGSLRPEPLEFEISSSITKYMFVFSGQAVKAFIQFDLIT